jgi:Bacteriocin-protection, YdeI or OmpD-Associated
MRFFCLQPMRYEMIAAEDGSLVIHLDNAFALTLLENSNKRVVVSWSGHHHHCAILKSREWGYYLRFGKAHHKKWGLHPGLTISATIKPDTSTYQFSIPDTLEEVLASDDLAMHFWKTLTPGKQRSLIYQIAKIKSTELQINKSLLLAERLKMGITDPMRMLRPLE